ncbi:MAG: hypothetical protein M0P73_19745 [Syntrophobacterales bacterium]|jgi:hypothetical protein|nr:hypothetical protein [Syntrophobacterales bacterium]
MRARWGIAWLLTAFWLVAALCAPAPAATGDSAYRSLPIRPIEAQTSLETQMLGEKPLKAPNLSNPLLPGSVPSLQLHQDGGDASVKLPKKLELNISIRYNRDPSPAEPQRLHDSPLYMKYSMDYRLLSNLRVGLNSYLYRPSEEGFPFQRPMVNQVVGFGPQIKYDLGRWSFLVKSQMESGSLTPAGNLNRSDDLQNWLRVWYAF